MISLTLFSLILLLCLIWKFKYRNNVLEPPLLPGWYPIIGHGYKLMGSGVDLLKSFITAAEDTDRLGGVTIAFLCTSKCYFVTDPDDIVTVMNHCLQKHVLYDIAKPALGNGILTADATVWKKNRRLLNPAFNQKVLDGFIETLNTQAEKLVEQFAKEVGKPFDQDVLLRVNNLETLCITSLGVFGIESEYNALLKEYLSHAVALLDILNARLQKFWLLSDFIYSFSKEKKDQDHNINHVNALSKLIFEKKKLERMSTPNSTNKSEKIKPYLDLLLDLSEQFDFLSDQQIQWETGTIIGAGHETTATALTFALAVLGSHPDVQEKAYKEICQVLGNDKAVTKEQLSQLVYIDAIVKESQRLYSLAAMLPRHVERDLQLKNYTLKAGTGCVVFLHSLHRHSMWGADADQFRPERWLDKETLPDPKYYGAFGLGRRNCIGRSYGIMNMKIILAHVIKKYHISSDINKIVMKMELLIRPHTGHHISLYFRK